MISRQRARRRELRGAAIVRVESSERIRIGRVLDQGAAGVMVPRLDKPDEVAAVLTHLRYPPHGDRGVATYNRSCRLGIGPLAADRSHPEHARRDPDRDARRVGCGRRDRRPGRRGRLVRRSAGSVVRARCAAAVRRPRIRRRHRAGARRRGRARQDRRHPRRERRHGDTLRRARIPVRGNRFRLNHAGRRAERRVRPRPASPTPEDQKGRIPSEHNEPPHRRRADQCRLDGAAAYPRLPQRADRLPRARHHARAGASPPTPPRTGPSSPATFSATPVGTTDYREVLADPEVDVVSICAPNFLHAEIGVAAAQAGKHFWIEKPVGRSYEETSAIDAAATKAGVITSIGYNYRHAPAVEHAREPDRGRQAGPDHQRPRRLLLRLRQRTQGRAVVAVQSGTRRHRACWPTCSATPATCASTSSARSPRSPR